MQEMTLGLILALTVTFFGVKALTKAKHEIAAHTTAVAESLGN